MLNLIGAVAGLMAVTVNLIAITTILPLSLVQRLKLGGILGAWVGLASGLGAAGQLEFAPDRPVPLVGVLFVTPLLMVGALAIAYPGVRRALLGIPTHLLIGLNSFRIFGALFLMLAVVGRLSGPFPFSAGLGDIVRDPAGPRCRPRRRSAESGDRALGFVRGVGSRGGGRPGPDLGQWKPNADIPHGRRLRGNAAAALLLGANGARALLSDHPRRGGVAAHRQQPQHACSTRGRSRLLISGLQLGPDSIAMAWPTAELSAAASVTRAAAWPAPWLVTFRSNADGLTCAPQAPDRAVACRRRCRRSKP